MPGRSGVTVVTNSCVCFLYTRLRAHRAPGIPSALYSQSGETVFAQLGRLAPRECGVVCEIVSTSLRGAKRRSNPLLLRGNMDCFASLAMTALYSTIAWLFEKLNRQVVPASAPGQAAPLATLGPIPRAPPRPCPT